MINQLETAIHRLRIGLGPGAAANANRMLRAAVDNRSVRAHIAQLAAVMDSVEVGLVSVDSDSDFAYVNQTAATLLHIRVGNTTPAGFFDVVTRLSNETLNQTEARAALRLLQDDPSAEIKTTWQYMEAPTHLGVVCKPAPFPGFNGRIWAFYDNSALAEAIESSDRANSLWRANTEAMLDPQALLEGVWRDGHVVDLVHRDVNKAACEYLGLSREELLGHSLVETVPTMAGDPLLTAYLHCAETGAPVIIDDYPLQNPYMAESRYYDTRASQPLPGWITVTWRDVTERTELTRRVAATAERFRLLAENVADVVTRLDDEGTITWISKSVEKALGEPPEFWVGKQALDFGPPDQRASAVARWAEITGGGTTLGRARLMDADGNTHTIHLHSKPYFDADGRRDGVVVSFRVIDREVAVEERARWQIMQRDRQNQALTRLLQAQTDRLMSDINSAAKYVASILPGDLDGPVPVNSRYVSSRELGGDSYDYRWIDDDHLIVYLLDVSGHGAEPAMVSVSVHNLLRSGTFSPSTLRQPAEVLNELNRMFPMEQHGGNYFTIWYGVFNTSTRTLDFASAGHPPALLLTNTDGAVTATQLSTVATPIGLFDDTTFTSSSYVVPHGTQLLVYSDGAFELALADGSAWSLAKFSTLCQEAMAADGCSLDGLIARLQEVTASGLFEDDCTLVRLSFP